MLHLAYILAFTVIAFLAVSNLIRSLVSVSMGTQQRPYRQNTSRNSHPELFDEDGVAINEPLMVMRSVNVEDARERLDALYNNSSSTTTQDVED